MIARLRGKLASVHPECVVDVGGVGYEVMIPERVRERLGPAGADVEFYTYLYVREDRLVLYGFVDEADRELFTRLIEVTGVGPKLALGMLSDHPAGRVAAAIRSKDTGFLKSLPGLGQKTAERLSMELADKLDEVGEAEPVRPGSDLKDEVVLALTSLGMTRHAALAVLDKLEWREGESVEDVVREALRHAGGV